jgi:hypothetical protein
MLIVFPESAPVSFSWDFQNHRQSEMDSAQKGKTELKDLPFRNSAQSKKIMIHTSFLTKLFS